MRPLSNTFDRQKDPNLFASVRKFNSLLLENKRPPNGQWKMILSRLSTKKGAMEFIRFVQDNGYTVLERNSEKVPVGLGEMGERVYIVFTHPDMEKLKHRNKKIVGGVAVGFIALLFLIFYMTNL